MQESTAALSVEAGFGVGRSLLQASGGYRERQRRIKQRAEVYPPVAFKVARHILSQNGSDSVLSACI